MRLSLSSMFGLLERSGRYLHLGSIPMVRLSNHLCQLGAEAKDRRRCTQDMESWHGLPDLQPAAPADESQAPVERFC